MTSIALHLQNITDKALQQKMLMTWEIREKKRKDADASSLYFYWAQLWKNR